MDIHVVIQGETMNSIAEIYGVQVDRLIQENEIRFPNNLVPGGTIVITYPERTYIVQEGDNLLGIADDHGITMMQLLRNNPFLVEREYIYPGETLVISYENIEKLTTIGYALPFIDQVVLKKTLPYLTYLFVYNYRLTADGEVENFYDDANIIAMSKEYGTIPVMIVTTLTAQGTENIQAAFDILLNEQIQDQLIDNVLEIMRIKGYLGFNMTFLYLTEANVSLYENFTRRVSRRLSAEGFIVFITIDPRINVINDDINFARINYSNLGREVNGISFLSYVWGTNIMPPAPITSIVNISAFLNYVTNMVPTDKISVGIQIIAYNWEIPYVAGFTRANSLTIQGAIDLAREVGAVIQFDEVSQAPYYEYERLERGSLKSILYGSLMLEPLIL